MRVIALIMPHSLLTLSLPLLAAALAAPVSFVLGHVSEADPANLYLVIGTEEVLNDLLQHPDVREVSPYRPPLSRLVTTTPELHASLVIRDYWTLPATALAELCGIEL